MRLEGLQFASRLPRLVTCGQPATAAFRRPVSLRDQELDRQGMEVRIRIETTTSS